MIEIVDNSLDENLFKSITSQVMDFDNCPWYFIKNSAFVENKNSCFDYSWFHSAIHDQEDNSPLAPDCRNVADQLKLLIPEEYGILSRARFGMHTAQQVNTTNSKHIDCLEDHYVALLYLNDSDGDTVIYDNNEELKRITPKANTVVVFDGKYFHASSTPTNNEYRITLNLNFTR